MLTVIAHTLKLVTWDLFRDTLRFPLWWYKDGLLLATTTIYRWAFDWHNRLGVGIWIKNWFKPMYAQYDWQGRLISLFFRSLMIIWKSILFLLGLLVFLFIYLLYLVAPLVAIIFFILSWS